MAGTVTEGLVLRQVDVGEASRIVSLLTADRGRIEVRIPGARKSRKRFGGLDLFVLASLELSSRPGKTRLDRAEVLRDFSRIRSDLSRLALASYAAELLVQSAQEEDGQSDLFLLALAAFESLDCEAQKEVGGLGWARAFELKLLHVLGMRPSLRRCIASGRLLEDLRSPLWSVAQGGLLCEEMRDQDPRARPIAPAAVTRLDEALRRPLSEQSAVSWSAPEARSAAVAMREYVSEYISPRQRSLAVLESVLPLFLCSLLVSACAAPAPPSSVRVEGYLFDSAAPAEEAIAIVGAGGEVWDDEGASLGTLSAPFSDFPGWYRAEALPPSERVHLLFETGEDHVATILTGWTAADDLFVDRGTFHLWPLEAAETEVGFWLDGMLTSSVEPPSFDPERAGEGGVVFGQLASAQDHTGSELLVVDSLGNEFLARTTDAEGQAGPGGPTGPDGRFAVFGLAPGPVDFRLRRADGGESEAVFRTGAAEDAITSLPRFTLP
ncbi:MAG: DNA repair protein RecO [Myxococcota bacterium]|nr:DNA repair protein RecO [Myxococcota bacterium]